VWSAGILIITDEQVNIALKNGLSRDTVRNRVYNLKWPIERAISTPIRSKPHISHTKQDIQDAEANGIEFSTFYARTVTYKWDVEEAKSKPLQYRIGDSKMDWNQKIDALKRDLVVMEKWFKDNHESIPAPLIVPVKESISAMIRQIKRLEINAKDFDES
jgi:hypothetical protein